MPIFSDQLEKYRRKPTLDFWPFSYKGSINLHWERALLEMENLHTLSPELKAFLRAKLSNNTQTDLKTLTKLEVLFKQASLSTTRKIIHTYSFCVDWLSLFRNVYEILALSIKPLALQLPFIGLAWQLFDTVMLGVMTINTDQKKDKWARNHYLYNTAQLTLCTGIALSALIVSACSLLSIISTLASSIGGASALVISWLLSERAAKLCDARIHYLMCESLSTKALSALVDQETISQLQASYQKWCQEIQSTNNSEESYKALIKSLQQLEKSLKVNDNSTEKIHEAVLALTLCTNQIKKREFLYRLEKPLKFYALTTVTLAILTVALLAIGANIATFGFAAALFCSAMVIFSSIYNLYQKNKLLNTDNNEDTHCKTIGNNYSHTLFTPPLNDANPNSSPSI